MRITVIGAGNGGTALAAFLALNGHKITLYNRGKEKIHPVMITKTIKLRGSVNTSVKIYNATTDIQEAVNDAEVIMIVLPAFAHKSIAEKVAPYLKDGQTVILNPGRTYGALEFLTTLNKLNCKKDIIVAEAQTFIFASRLLRPGMARIFGIKNNVPISSVPECKNKELKKIAKNILKQFDVVDSSLYTSFSNIGAIFHPATIIFNIARMEALSDKFEFYLEGISPSVARVLEKLDEERLKIASAIGVNVLSAKDWLKYAYSIDEDSLYNAIRKNKSYQGILVPLTLNNRYIYEDIPMSLTPMLSTAKKLKIETPTIESIINIGSIMTKTDLYNEGRTLEGLGIESISKLKEVLKGGMQ